VSRASERWKQWNSVSWAASLLALLVVLLLMSRGVAIGRLWPVAAFVALWLGATSYVLLASAAMRRRAARLQGAAVPRGVRLRQPIWMALADGVEMVAFAAPLAALAALIGFPGVGAGILLALGGVGFAMVAVFASLTAFTFEAGGLRVHDRKREFFVPWSCVLEVDVTGSAENPATNVRVVARDPILATVTPNTSRNRWYVELQLRLGSPSGQALLFNNWAGGLDSATLARGMREAMGRRASQAN
jgi:hypothetical protein